MSAVEMHSKLNVAKVKCEEAMVAIDDAIAYGSTHNATDSLADLNALKTAMTAPLEAVKEDVESFSDYSNMT